MAQQTRHQLQAKRLAGTAGALFKEGKLEQAAESFTEALELLDDGDSEQNLKVRPSLPAASLPAASACSLTGAPRRADQEGDPAQPLGGADQARPG